MPSELRTPSVGTTTKTVEKTDVQSLDHQHGERPLTSRSMAGLASGDEADTDGEREVHDMGSRDNTVSFRDFENEKGSGSKSPETKPKKKTKRKHRKYCKHGKHGKKDDKEEKEKHEEIVRVSMKPLSSEPSQEQAEAEKATTTPQVSFFDNTQVPESSPKRPFTIRGLPSMPAMPAMPRMLSTSVFSTQNPTGLPTSAPPAQPMTSRTLPQTLPHSIHRSSSLPSRLNQMASAPVPQPQPYMRPVTAAHTSFDSNDEQKVKKHMSRTSAIILLLVSTGLVAICAEFLVDSINYLVNNTSVSEAFIGLIILPIVGNAAEHVTAVTVATKNKMDLAIGVAVGSSIQIALFVTPVIVLLGWILTKDMSLYFSLFETISLFVTAFVVNFLVLDGRSNYLEGALLIAAYVIIAVAAFFYPDSSQQSPVGGASNAANGTRLLF